MTLAITNDIRAAANRALMAGSADYFSWSPDAQERFRATAGMEVRHRIEQILLKEILGIDCSVQDAADVWRNLSLEQLNQVNPADLLTQGIGEDFVFLNESLAEDVSLLDFETLYDYDHDDFLFQEKWRHRELKSYTSPGYFPLHHPRWIRLVMDNELVYGNLYSLAGYVVDRVSESGDDQLDELIPSSYVQGPNHGKPEKGGMLWDYQLDAGGQEAQLEEVRRRWWQYQQDIELALHRELAAEPPQAYILRDKSLVPGEINVNFVIQNEKAMHRIRWRSFLGDMQVIEGSLKNIESLVARETEKAQSFIEQQYLDVMDNFIPPDIKPGKKRKLVMSPGALDDLQRLSSDDAGDKE